MNLQAHLGTPTASPFIIAGALDRAAGDERSGDFDFDFCFPPEVQVDPCHAFGDAVMAALGGRPEVIVYDTLQRFATSDKRGDLAGWSMLFADGRAGVYGCWRTGVDALWQAPGSKGGFINSITLQHNLQRARTERAAQLKLDRDKARHRNVQLWAQCQTVVDGDPVDRYLKRRLAQEGLVVPMCLRFHPSLDYWHNGVRVGSWPAMVAPLVDTAGDIVALHRTWLTKDGHKADVPGPVKKLTKASGPLAGTHVPLAEPQFARLGVAEGIETALAAQSLSSAPTVAAYSAGNLAAFCWPVGVQQLIVFADADKAGLEAADALQARAVASGLQCKVISPHAEDLDWCDVCAGRSTGQPKTGGLS